SRATSSCSTTSAWPTTAWPMASRSGWRRASWDSRWASVVTRCSGSGGEGVHHDVDGELGVVFGEPALVAPVVVPFAAVVLVAVEHAQAALVLDALEVVVHQVVAPAVEFEAGGGRAVELEETRVQRVV